MLQIILALLFILKLVTRCKFYALRLISLFAGKFYVLFLMEPADKNLNSTNPYALKSVLTPDNSCGKF